MIEILMATKRPLLLLIASALGAFVSVIGALDTLQCVRAVTAATIVAGAFGSGAALTAAVQQWRSGGSAHAPV